MIAPVYLEFSVVLLGILLLMAESFGLVREKTTLAWWSIVGLAGAFVLTFFLAPNPAGFQDSGFYVVDDLSMFFKRFAIVSTILVLILAVDFLPIVQRLVPGERPGALRLRETHRCQHHVGRHGKERGLDETHAAQIPWCMRMAGPVHGPAVERGKQPHARAPRRFAATRHAHACEISR